MVSKYDRPLIIDRRHAQRLHDELVEYMDQVLQDKRGDDRNKLIADQERVVEIMRILNLPLLSDQQKELANIYMICNKVEQGLALYEEVGDSYSYVNIAVYYEKIGDANMALRYYQKAAQVAKVDKKQYYEGLQYSAAMRLITRPARVIPEA